MSYQTDQIVEKACADFADSHFWLPRAKQGVTFRRFQDTTNQFAGIDLQFNHHLIDEKVKFKNCWNNPLNYIGFEVSFIDRGGNLHQGWLTNKKLKTTIYAILSPYLKQQFIDSFNKPTIRDSYITAQMLDKMIMLLISKSNLLRFINQYTSLEQIQQDAQLLRYEYDNGDTQKRHKYHHNMFWLTYSPQLKEKPVNLVILRDTILANTSAKQIEIK